MSTRGGKRRGRPPKTPVSDRNSNKFQYQLLKKPKYLTNRGSDSQFSTPSVSRASSPPNSDDGHHVSRRTSSRPSRRGRPSQTPAPSKRGAHTAPTGRRAYESEYHYGSDFGDSSDEREQEEDFILSGSESDSVDPIENESDSDFSLSSYSTHSNVNNTGKKGRLPTPEPVWLQDVDVPELELPRSSDDLIAPQHLVLRITSLYEVLRRFRNLVRLSPFRLEDFCAALVCEEQSNLLSEIHMMLLKAIIREEDTQSTHFGPLDQKDSVNISLYLMDDYTWPEIMRSYVESDAGFDSEVLDILTEKEYPFCEVEDRIRVLQFLIDQLLITTPVRDTLLQEGPILYDDHCRICHRLGDLLCCETCPAVYHLECVDPPLPDVPTEDWQCNICKEHKLSGVNDCMAEQEKHGMLCRQDHLGYDRHGRKYWFVCRRIFVETEDGDQLWYYSTVTQLEALLSRLDEDSLELGLCGEISSQRDEIIRQMELTESLTNQHKGGKKSYFDVLQDRARFGLDLDDDGVIIEEAFEEENDGCMTRNRLQEISTGTRYFKLGMENAFKTYENQFTINVNALNKPQRNEERDKKRHLSHKFSLTDASQFKWTGGSSTSIENIVLALRATLMQLEQTIPPPYMHPNWLNLKKVWLQAVLGSEQPQDFTRILIALQACIKGVLFANVWYEQLGHTRLYRITSNEREEKKKQEKREKRDYADEEERNRWAYNFVKYTLGMKHQCWKQKGEEYRIHGQWSWMWLSSNRREARNQQPALYYMEAHKVMVMVKNQEDQVQVIAVTPITYERLVGCEGTVGDEFGPNCGIVSLMAIPDEYDYIDVGAALTTPGRILYPKVAKRSRLDCLLARRTALLEAEEKELAAKDGSKEAAAAGGMDIEDAIPKQTISTGANLPNISCTENDILKIVGDRPGNGLNKANQAAAAKAAADADAYNALAKEIQPVKTLCHTLTKMAKNFKCYDKDCNMGPSLVLTKVSTCYSPMCMQRDRVRAELLKLIRKAHTAGFSSKDLLSNKVTIQASAEVEDSTGILDMDGGKTNEDTLVPVTSVYDTAGILKELKQALEKACEFDEDAFHECLTKKAFELEMEEKAEADDKLKQEEEAKAAEELSNPTPIKMDGEPEKFKDDTLNGDESLLAAKDESLGGAGDPESTPKRSLRGRPPKGKSVTKWREERALAAENGELTKNGLPEEKTHKWSVLKPKRRFTNKNPKLRREKMKLDPEYGPGGVRRVYSVKCTQGKVSLRKQLKARPPTTGPVLLRGQKGRLTNKYPIVGNFMAKTGRRCIIMLPKHELLHVARCGGRVIPNGYNPLSKTNISAWPYPCPRPLFKTCWIYRMLNAKTLNALCLGLRIMWTCFRWDDMQTKPPTLDGKNQVTTENEIISLELLKHRHLGRFMDRTQYLRRKVIIPLELPKAVREVTSIRLGLRKRKRADSPQHTEPQVTEEWIDEEKLDLWEIRQYGERQDRVNVLPVTRQATGKLPPARQFDIVNNSSGKQIVVMGKSSEEIKERLEQQLRMQRAALNHKRALENKGLPGTSTPKQIIKYKQIQVRQPDGSIKVINQQIITNPPAPRPTEQKVQIFRGPDGKLSVKGLLPGQQVIQMPDGKMHIVTAQSNSGVKAVVNRPAGSVITTQSGQQLIVKQSPGASASKTIVQKILNPSTPNILQKTPQTKLVAKVMSSSDGASPSGAGQPKVVTSLQQLLAQNPGQKIVLNQGMPNQRILIAPPNNSSQPGTPQQQILVQQPGGQVIQQIVQSGSPGQQQIVVGNRIVMNTTSGQRIITTAPVQAATIVSPVKTIVQQQQQQPVVVAAAANPQIQYQAIPAQPQAQQQQVMVQNNQSIAQQLASGKLQMMNYNGQQVIVKPMGNNSAVIVAHVKQQENGPAQIVLTAQASGIIASDESAQGGETAIEGEPAATSSQQATQVQQPGTITKTITAQLLQTENGPRIVLQGLGQNDLTPQQLAIVQQQVKQSLMKSQDGKLSTGPTRIQITIAQQVSPPPLTPVSASKSGTGQQTGEEVQDEAEHDGGGEASASGASINEQTRKGIYQKVMARTVGKAMNVVVNPKPGQIIKLEGQSIVGKSNNSAIGQPTTSADGIAGGSSDGEDNGFKITPDYIQETIRNALKQSNLNPDIEEKLLNLQRYQEQQMKDGLDAPYTYTPVTPTYTTTTQRKRVLRRDDDDDDLDDDMDEIDIPEDDDDEDWFAHKRRRKPYIPKSERKSLVQRNISPFARPKPAEMTDPPRLIIQQATTATHSPMVAKVTKSQPQLVALQPKPHKVIVKSTPPRVIYQVVDQKKKLSEVLNQQKDQLREDILRKREQFEQELKQEIQEEVNSKLVVIRGTGGGGSAVVEKDQENMSNKATVTPVLEKTRKRSSASGTAQARKEFASDSCSADESPPKLSKVIYSGAKKSQRSQNTTSPAGVGGSSSKKKEKLFCICRTPYDKNKFYLGCDLCNNWFHGTCVGITETESKKMDEYICDECNNAREKQVLYCLCKQPYDESQFYICCDKCQDWFHGRCVNVSQKDADSIDEYVCPNCTKNDSVSTANMKELTEQEFENLEKLIKTITTHNMAWPFLEPVDPKEVADYYTVIKEPMHLYKIQNRIETKWYTTLSQFIGDMTKVFDNCRFYNPKGSQFYKCAEVLEALFLQNIKQFRDNVATMDKC